MSLHCKMLAALFSGVLLLAGCNSQPAKTPQDAGQSESKSSDVSEDKTPSASSEKVSIETLQEKAKQGDAQAQFQLATCYFTGKDVPVNNAEELFECFLGNSDIQDLSDEKVNEALDLLKKSADQDNVEAQTAIGAYYGIFQFDKLTFEDKHRVRKASDKGKPLAQALLGIIYLRDLGGVPAVRDKALELIRSAADKGDGFALSNLGQFYLNGRFVEKDLDKGFELMSKAADHENADSLYMVGVCNLMGIYVEKNVDKGLKMITKASEKGDPSAQFTLGILYYNGDSVPQDKAKGIELIRKTAKWKMPQAVSFVESIDSDPNGDIPAPRDILVERIRDAFEPVATTDNATELREATKLRAATDNATELRETTDNDEAVRALPAEEL